MEEKLPTDALNATTVNPNIPKQVEVVKKEKSNTKLLIIILLICVFILLALLVYIYFTQNQTKPTLTNQTISQSLSSTISSKGLEFSTFSNEYISFRYPKGWRVVLNEPNSPWVGYDQDPNKCPDSRSGFSGVAGIRLISPENKELEFSNYWSVAGSGAYQYNFSDPLVLDFLSEGGSPVVKYQLSSQPTIIPLSFGGAIFSGEVTIDGQKVTLMKLVYKEALKPDSLSFSDEFEFAFFTSDSEYDRSIINKLKYDGLYNCERFENSGGVLLIGYEELNDTPENVANILDTFISSIVRKK